MLGKYNRRTVRASSGAVAPGATVSFFWQANGTPAMVYADQDGNNAIGSSVQSDADGRIAVFVTPGLYRIVVTLDGVVIEELTHEPIVGQLAYADPNSYALRSELKLHDEDIQLVAKSLVELKLAGGPRLASGRVLSADEIGMLADTGAMIKTTEYHDGTSIGGGEYQLRTRASYRAEIGDAAWIPDGYGDHYLFGSTTLVAVLRIEKEVSITQFGARPAPGVDNGPVFGAIGEHLSEYRGQITIPPGVFETNSTFMVPPNCSLVGAGRQVSIVSAKDSTGTFTDNAVVIQAGEEPTQIAGLSGNVIQGGTVLSFTAAHGLQAGDTVLIYNPTDGSWSSWRPVYRAGEFATVSSVPSSTSVTLESPLYDTYTAASVAVYECSGAALGSMSGFSVVAPGTTSGNNIVQGVVIDYCRGGVFQDLGASNSDNASMAILHSYKVTMRDIDAHQWSMDPGFTTQYGLVVGNCQESNISGRFIGYRHGIAFGGGNSFAITNRAVRVHDFIAKNFYGGIAAADWHGNVEHCVYENGKIFGGGLNIAGNHNRISNIEGYGHEMMIILGREILGCDHVMENCTFWTGRNDTLRGLINIGGNESSLNSQTTMGGTLTFKNIKVTAPSNTTGCISIRNRGATVDWHVVARDIEYVAPSVIAATSSALRHATVSGSPASTISVSGLRVTAGSGSHLTLSSGDSGTLVGGSRLTGTVSVETTTSSNFVDQPVTFSEPFAKAPAVVTNSGDTSTGSDTCMSVALNVTASGFTARYFRVDQVANFTGALTRTVKWTASLDEF